MNYFTFNLSSKQLNTLADHYKNNIESVRNFHIEFSAYVNDITINAYKTGKVVLQGPILTTEIASIKSLLKIEDYAAIGSDEVGTGDLFGPVVVCASYVSKDDIPFLEELNVRDSKGIPTREILRLAKALVNRIEYSLVILTPKQYNSMVEKGFNLNKIKAFLHNHAIIRLTSKVQDKVPVIVDQFCTPKNYFNYLKDESYVYHDIVFHKQAEKVHLSVAASSIIARYAFLAKMHEYSKTYKTKLKLGASKEAYAQFEQLVKDQGKGIIPDLVKTNFKNVKELM